MLFILIDAEEEGRGSQGSACVGPLYKQEIPPSLLVAECELRKLSRQSALLFIPHPRPSCDFHMVSLLSLINQQSEGPPNKDKVTP